ncbi:MAG: cell division/cell wall cluster transcriptional repressor MraZ [Propionibacteriaceae bacterium]|jgi:MraZ protein|nr:cell division/cell wall cluster transcriptional repressor MraZ [Propionibacteriaceae bacterium]
MLKGRATPKLDEKNRLTVPVRYRKELGFEVTVVCEPEHCLGVYGREVFEAQMRRFMEAPATLRQVRDYQRWMNARAEDVEPDGQGRITLTPQQRDWARVDREVIVIGGGNRLEVWNPANWADREAQLDEEFADFDGLIATDG